MRNYMKFIFCFVCICMLTAGCGKETTAEGTSEEGTIIETSAVETDMEEDTQMTETEELDEESLNDVGSGVIDVKGVAYDELPADIKGTLIPIDSLLLYHVEIGGEYMPDDPAMLLQTMHYAIVNYGEYYSCAELRESELAAKSTVIGEFMSALTTEVDDIPSIPEELSDRIRYDSEEDMYFFGVGDRGLSQTEILSYEYVDNDTLKVSARLFAVDDDSTICQGEFTLVRNDYAAENDEPQFYFTVSEAEFDAE